LHNTKPRAQNIAASHDKHRETMQPTAAVTDHISPVNILSFYSDFFG
jgi:hypothetical protein